MNADAFFNWAEILAKSYFKRSDVELFYYKLNIPEKYEENETKETSIKYYNAIDEWNKKTVPKNIGKSLGEILTKLEWNGVANEILDSCASKEAILFNYVRNIQLNNFTGREDYLTTIERKFEQENVLVYVGMGGVGKTLLISEYIERNKTKYKRIVWFNSDQKVNLLEKEFLKFGKEYTNMKEGEMNITKIVNWFENTENGWLIVFDNAKNQESIENFMPSKGGKILITSRNRFFEVGEKIELGLFDQKDVKEYLLKLKIEEGKTEVLKTFGNQPELHPLAISLAAAYIKNLRISISKFNEKKLEFIRTPIKVTENQFENCDMPVFENLLISVKEIHVANQSAFDALIQCAFLLPNKIPRNLFNKEVLGILNEYSLITLEDENLLSIHRLIQESLIFEITRNYKTEKDVNKIMYPGNTPKEVVQKAYKRIFDCYPIGRISKNDLILKSHLFPHYQSLNIHLDKLNGVEDCEWNGKKIDLPNPFKIKEDMYNLSSSSKLLNELKKTKTTFVQNPNCNSIIDALKYFELSCQNRENIVKNLNESLKIFKNILNENHELILEINYLLAFQHRQIPNFHWEETLGNSEYSLSTRYNLGRSYYFESRWLEDENRENLTKNKEILTSYVDAYNIQRTLERKDWILYFSLELSRARKKIEDLCLLSSKLFNETLKKHQVEDQGVQIFDLYHDLILHWTNERKPGISLHFILIEILEKELKWIDVVERIPNKWKPKNPDDRLRNEMIEKVFKNNPYFKTELEDKFNESRFIEILNLYNIQIVFDHPNNNLLHIATELELIEIVKFFIEKGAKLNVFMKDTPLDIAVKNESIDIAKLMLQSNTLKLDECVKSEREFLDKPLFFASSYGNAEIVKLIVEITDNVNVCFLNETPLQAASFYGYEEIVEILLEKGASIDDDNLLHMTPLHTASSRGHVEIVKLLLEKGAKVDDLNQDASTPLHLASSKGFVEIVKLLLDKGANFEARDKNNTTPLHFASNKGHPEVVKSLLQKGAKINSYNNDFMTSLHFAAAHGHVGIVKLLLERGASVDVFEFQFHTPLLFASMKGSVDIVELLLLQGAEIDGFGMENWTPLHSASATGHANVVELLLKKGATINIKNNIYSTPLHLATSGGHAEVVGLLLDKGADVNALSKGNLTSLHYASSKGFLKIVKLLLKKGAIVNIKEINGYTPLHLATRGGHAEVVGLLLNKGARVDEKNTDGLTPLDIAMNENHEIIVNLLLSNL